MVFARSFMKFADELPILFPTLSVGPIDGEVAKGATGTAALVAPSRGRYIRNVNVGGGGRDAEVVAIGGDVEVCPCWYCGRIWYRPRVSVCPL